LPRCAVLTRRRLLWGSLAAAGIFATGACGRRPGPELLLPAGLLPQVWARTLPQPWRLSQVDQVRQVLDALERGSRAPGLVALSDGWASYLERRWLQPFGAARLLARLAPAAAAVSRLYGPAATAPLAFPWSMSPWVLALRNQGDLLDQARQSWEVLLDRRLQGRLVLPSSPRISIALMRGNLTRLRQLRRNALACDEANGLNLLLRGQARAAVLPLQRLIPLLRQDPRLQVVLPASGAPLTWQLLLRPAASVEPPPLAWLEQALEPPLLPRLLAIGVVPPLPRATLLASAEQLPQVLVDVLIPPEALLQRCWSLPPLSARQRLGLQTLWDLAAA